MSYYNLFNLIVESHVFYFPFMNLFPKGHHFRYNLNYLDIFKIELLWALYLRLRLLEWSKFHLYLLGLVIKLF